MISPFSTRIDDAPGSAGGAVARLVGQGVTGAIALLAGLLVFVPMRLALGGIPDRAGIPGALLSVEV